MERMKRIFFIFSIITLVSASSVFAQQNESSASESDEPGSNSAEAFEIIPNLEAEEVADTPQGGTKAVFKTNVKNCTIFLNGNYQGRSQLTLANLVEGFYLLRVEKNGYQFQENFVYIEHGKTKTFYIELQPTEETQKKLDAEAERKAQSDSASSQGADSGSGAANGGANSANAQASGNSGANGSANGADSASEAGIGGVDAK